MEKMYFSIKEAAERVELKPHVLRYWETEFPLLNPKKNRSGTRMYREADIALLHEIKELLHEQRFTIEGARNELKRRRGDKESGIHAKRASVIGEAKVTLREILDLLEE